MKRLHESEALKASHYHCSCRVNHNQSSTSSIGIHGIVRFRKTIRNMGRSWKDQEFKARKHYLLYQRTL